MAFLHIFDVLVLIYAQKRHVAHHRKGKIMELGKYENFASNYGGKRIIPSKVLVICDPLDLSDQTTLRKMLLVAGVDEIETFVMTDFNESDISLVNPEIIIVMGTNIKNKLSLTVKYKIQDISIINTKYRCVVLDHPKYLSKYPSNKKGSPKYKNFKVLQEIKFYE